MLGGYARLAAAAITVNATLKQASGMHNNIVKLIPKEKGSVERNTDGVIRNVIGNTIEKGHAGGGKKIQNMLKMQAEEDVQNVGQLQKDYLPRLLAWSGKTSCENITMLVLTVIL